MSKAIRIGQLLAAPLPKGWEDGKIENRNQVIALMASLLEEILKGYSDPDLSSEENRKEVGEAVRALLAELREAGIAEWEEAGPIVDQVLGQTRRDHIFELIDNNWELRANILNLAKPEWEEYPLTAEIADEEELDGIADDPVYWAQWMLSEPEWINPEDEEE